MFLVFSKEKICTYIVSILTVFLLFFVANTMKSDNFNAIATSSNDEKLLPIYNVQTQDKKISLTMNCAWNADDVDKILEVLNQNSVKITFFMVGDWIEKFPDSVKKIYESGNEIASHSDTHPHVNNLSYEENIEEIEKSNQKIEKITGQRTKIYRAPYGEYNDIVIRTAKNNGYYPIQWNLDTLDYKGYNSMYAGQNGTKSGYWWLASPSSGYSGAVCNVYGSNATLIDNGCSGTCGVAPLVSLKSGIQVEIEE